MTNKEKYREIMRRYRNGEFGREPLSLHEILERAGSPDLLREMSKDDIQSLLDESCGCTRMMFKKELERKEGQKKTMYYIYEFEMPEKTEKALIAAADKAGKSLDTLVADWLKWFIDHPEEIARLKGEYENMTKEERETLGEVHVVRSYPVLDGETEAEAKLRALREEGKEMSILGNIDGYEKLLPYLPRVGEKEFCEHMEDNDFYEKYGNPVLVCGKDGRDVVFESFELYAREMEAAGRGDEVEKIRKQIKAECDDA